jgi:vacuolar-type H+-ATPase subunit I/STV1
MAERRHATRKKSFLRGCVYFNKRRGAMDCLIRDLSEAGARIIFASAVNGPDVVELYIPQKEETIRARVKWRHGDEVGLAFPAVARAAEAPADDGDLAQRVEKLETEIAALRRMLKQLRNELAATGEVEAA